MEEDELSFGVGDGLQENVSWNGKVKKQWQRTNRIQTEEKVNMLETGIEPMPPPWEGEILPLNYSSCCDWVNLYSNNYNVITINIILGVLKTSKKSFQIYHRMIIKLIVYPSIKSKPYAPLPDRTMYKVNSEGDVYNSGVAKEKQQNEEEQ